MWWDTIVRGSHMRPAATCSSFVGSVVPAERPNERLSVRCPRGMDGL
jgi:hypothetical protein